MFHITIKTKLCFSISLILILAFVAINLLNYHVSRTALRESIIQEALPGISNEIYHDIQKDLITPVEVSSLMANDTFLKDWVMSGEKDVSKIIRYLWEIKDKYGFVSTFLISSKTRQYYHFKGVHKRVSPDDAHDDWYFDFISGGEDYDLDVDTDEAANNELTVFINHRLTDYHGKLLGVTGVGLKMREVGRLLDSYNEKYNKKVYLVDRSGLVQVHTDQSRILNADITEMDGIGKIAEKILTDTATSTVTVEYDREGEHFLVLSKYIPQFDWFLVVEHKEGKEMQEIRTVFTSNLVIGLVVTLLVIIINVFMVNYFQKRLEDLATTDELTGLANRRFFMGQAKKQLAGAQRSGLPLSLLLIDFDHFKQINDNWGHEIGDRVLKESSDLFLQTLRKADLAGRLGGEEFAVLLPQAGMKEAEEVAHRLCRLVEHSNLPAGVKDCPVTISVGAATLSGDEVDLESLMNSADRALYSAKELGRNTVFCATEEKNFSG